MIASPALSVFSPTSSRASLALSLLLCWAPLSRSHPCPQRPAPRPILGGLSPLWAALERNHGRHTQPQSQGREPGPRSHCQTPEAQWTHSILQRCLLPLTCCRVCPSHVCRSRHQTSVSRTLLSRGRNTQVCVHDRSRLVRGIRYRFLVITHPDVHAGIQSSTETAPKPVDLATAGGRVCTGQWT